MNIFIISALVAAAISLVVMHFAIPFLHKLKFGQPIRDDGPQSHLKKSGTPTMGGIFVALAMVIAGLILTFVFDASEYLWMGLAGSILFSVIGFIDDFKKIREKNSKGISALTKIVLQIVVGLIIAFVTYYDKNIGSGIYIPFYGKVVDFGIFYFPFIVIFMIAMTNSVNLIDGLDGLCGSVSTVTYFTFALIFALSGDVFCAKDGSIFTGIVFGAVIGFLFYNFYPAKVFMGDSGSFLIGGTLCVMSVLTRLELLIPIIGFMYMLTSISCILQVGYFKITHGKRIFRMAPLHHHFELKGVHETKIVAVYTIITVGCCGLALLLI